MLRFAFNTIFSIHAKAFPIAVIPKFSFNYTPIRLMANHRHKKMVKLAKGYRGRANRCFTVAKQKVEKAWQYMYRDRKVRKREYRKLWIQRINAASRIYGVPYATLISRLNAANIKLNRKSLSNLAIYEPLSFKSVIEVANIKGASAATRPAAVKKIKRKTKDEIEEEKTPPQRVTRKIIIDL